MTVEREDPEVEIVLEREREGSGEFQNDAVEWQAELSDCQVYQ